MSGLRGRRVVVTRSESSGDPLYEGLAARGAVPLRFPAIRMAPPERMAPLDHALSQAGLYDWVVFTSANGVRSAFDRALEVGLQADAGSWLGHSRVAAVGPVTAAALAARGIGDVVVPSTFEGDAIPHVLGDVGGRRILLLRADRASPALPARLRELGGHVDDIVAYRTLPLDSPVRGAAADAVRAGFDAVTFTSPSTVEGFLNGVGGDWREVVGDAIVATIGPVTSGAARRAGLRVAVEADPHTIERLIAGLAARFDELERERTQ